MKAIPPFLTPMLPVGCVPAGCQTPAARSPDGRSAARATRDHCYGLLHQLLDDQKGAGLLHFIGWGPEISNSLVRRIAAVWGAGARLLEEFAKRDPSIHLDNLQLQPGETATREAIASAKNKELLGQTGAGFDLGLLLTQAEALGYAWHLANVAGENEFQPERARAMAAVTEDMKHLYQEVCALLLAKRNDPRGTGFELKNN